VTGAAIPEGSVVITPTEMYKDIIDTHRTVQAISTKLDGALSDNARRMEGIEKDFEKGFADHETRLRSVERRMWVAVGVSTALSGTAAALIAQFVSQH
jgi:hypothetical protein